MRRLLHSKQCGMTLSQRTLRRRHVQQAVKVRSDLILGIATVEYQASRIKPTEVSGRLSSSVFIKWFQKQWREVVEEADDVRRGIRAALGQEWFPCSRVTCHAALVCLQAYGEVCSAICIWLYLARPYIPRSTMFDNFFSSEHLFLV